MGLFLGTVLPVDPHDRVCAVPHCFVIVALWCSLGRQFFSLLNYEHMLIHLQETWKIQNKVPLYITIILKKINGFLVGYQTVKN